MALPQISSVSTKQKTRSKSRGNDKSVNRGILFFSPDFSATCWIVLNIGSVVFLSRLIYTWKMMNPQPIRFFIRYWLPLSSHAEIIQTLAFACWQVLWLTDYSTLKARREFYPKMREKRKKGVRFGLFASQYQKRYRPREGNTQKISARRWQQQQQHRSNECVFPLSDVTVMFWLSFHEIYFQFVIVFAKVPPPLLCDKSSLSLSLSLSLPGWHAHTYTHSTVFEVFFSSSVVIAKLAGLSLPTTWKRAWWRLFCLWEERRG